MTTLSLLKISGQNSELPMARSVRVGCNLENTTGHLKSFVLHSRPQHMHLPHAIKPGTLWQCWTLGELNRWNALIDTNKKFALQILKIKIFYWFLLAIRGLLPAFEILISVFWSMYMSHAKEGKNKAMQNHCSCGGMESPVHSPKATGLSKIYDFCLTHLREDSSHFLPLLELGFN